jgi:hypothetical protein
MPTLVRFASTLAVLAAVTFAAMLILADVVTVPPREISETVLDQPGKPSPLSAVSAAKARPAHASVRKSIKSGSRTRTAERNERDRPRR